MLAQSSQTRLKNKKMIKIKVILPILTVSNKIILPVIISSYQNYKTCYGLDNLFINK